MTSFLIKVFLSLTVLRTLNSSCFKYYKVPKIQAVALYSFKEKRSKIPLTVIGLNSTKLNRVALSLGYRFPKMISSNNCDADLTVTHYF